jgi:hypothetical protein
MQYHQSAMIIDHMAEFEEAERTSRSAPKDARPKNK